MLITLSVPFNTARGLTGDPVACLLHASGATRPYVVIRSNPDPMFPAFFIEQTNEYRFHDCFHFMRGEERRGKPDSTCEMQATYDKGK